jgi:CRP-like cAMP-binding protein
LLERLPNRLKSFKKERLGAFRGDPLDDMMFLLKGQLSAEFVSIKGKVLKVETLTAPTVIAGPLVFASENYLPVQLTALEDSEILSLSQKDALNLLSSDSHILQRFLRDSGDKVTFLSEKIRLYQFNNIQQKIALYFLDQMSRQRSSTIKLPLKIETLAELFSVSRPSLSRSLGELVDQGILERQGKSFLIPSEENLKDLLEE